MTEVLHEHAEILPPQLDLDNLFWIDPEQINEVNSLITTARLSTMVLGAQSRDDMFKPERSLLKARLVDEEHPGATQHQRAIDIGVMYGTLLADEEDPEPALPPEYAVLLEAMMFGIDRTDPNDANRLFMRLRDVEVALTGSDVLAFCLSASQDHLRNQLYSIQTEGRPLSSAELTWQQTLFYAGALTGALLKKDTSQYPLPRLEITRSISESENPLSVVLELEATDELEPLIEKLLSERYSFAVGDLPGKKAKKVIGVTASGVQFGPNQISMTLMNPNLMPPDILLNAGKLDCIVLGESQEDGSIELKVRKDVDVALEEYLAKERPLHIVALERAGNFLSTYGENHPFNSYITRALAAAAHKPADGFSYVTAEGLKYLEFGLPSKRAGRLILGGMVASTWAPEIVAAMSDEIEPNWAQGFTASGVAVLLYMGLRKMQQQLARSRAEDLHLHIGPEGPLLHRVDQTQSLQL